LIVTAWGGFKKNRIRGMLLMWGLYAVFGLILFGLGRGLSVWIPVAVLASMTFPVSQSASNAIWQSKVAPDIQGRVFSARRLIAWLMDPIMPLVAGATADFITEPAMAAGGNFASLFGGLVGTEPGSGMAVQYLFSGIGYLSVILIAWFIPRIRNVETDLPDHDQMKAAEEGESEA
jgi:hypothetical protein